MLIHKRRSGQPQGAFKLRSDLGFDSFILPGVGADLVTGAPVIMGGMQSVGQSANGNTFAGSTTDTSSTAWTIPNSSNFLSTTEATVLIAGKLIARFGSGAGSFGVASGDLDVSKGIGAYIPYSDGKIYWDFGGETEGTTRLSVAGLTFSSGDVFVFTTGPRGMEIWQNGKRVASNSANPTRTASSKAFGLRGHYFTGHDPFACFAFGYSRKQMPQSVCAALGRDLWGAAFVQRRRGIIAGIAAAARRRVVFWG